MGNGDSRNQRVSGRRNILSKTYQEEEDFSKEFDQDSDSNLFPMPEVTMDDLDDSKNKSLEGQKPKRLKKELEDEDYLPSKPKTLRKKPMKFLSPVSKLSSKRDSKIKKESLDIQPKNMAYYPERQDELELVGTSSEGHIIERGFYYICVCSFGLE